VTRAAEGVRFFDAASVNGAVAMTIATFEDVIGGRAPPEEAPTVIGLEG